MKYILERNNRYLELSKEWGSLGKYIEHIGTICEDKDLYQRIVNKYLKGYDPKVRISNAIDTLDSIFDKKQLVKELEREVLVKESLDIEQDLSKNTKLGKQSFTTFLKVLSALNIGDVKPDYVNCPDSFIQIYDYLNIEINNLKTILNRFRSFQSFVPEINEEHTGIYFGLKYTNKLYVEYGLIKKDTREVIGEFKVGQKELENIKTINNKNVQSFKDELNKLNLSKLDILNKIRIEIDGFNPGHFQSKGKSVIKLGDDYIKFNIKGLGEWNGPDLKEGELDKYKKEIKVWINSQKWKDSVLVSVTASSYNFTFTIKIR